jgi:hypothetical protein
MKRRTQQVLWMIAAVTCVTGFGLTGSASATEWDVPHNVQAAAPVCRFSSTSTTGGVTCTGARQYALQIRCYDPLRDSNSTFTGPWVIPGQWSRYTCPRQGNVQTTVNGLGARYR